MTSPIRLVATDLDGTIVRTDGTLSERTLRALKDVEASGRLVVLVSGRPPRWMHEIADATGHTGLALCSNGALCYDLHTERIIWTEWLSPETMADIVRRLSAGIADLVWAVEYGDGFGMETGYRHHYDLGTEATIGPVEKLIEMPAAKLLARHPSIDADTLMAQAIELAGDIATFTHTTYSGGGLLEISAHGVTKATGLATLAREHGIAAAETIAFGDMPNDVPMLAWAGRSVAVANAHPAVRAAADEVTLANDEDGVAVVLERLLLP
ncbi:MAG TPA: HAD family hydrolase [Mycobacteriales bacterium]|nr:HAD family hydrolase [Mycobacteriales bacterium]